jgi:DNA (cytosine-5)-methyltransferase 1
MIDSQLVLSTFSGIGLLDQGFENNGFCVVRAPEKILGGDIRNFKCSPGFFTGVIGGSPCPDFSRARRTAPSGEGLELLGEFCRVVVESGCNWFLLENVPGVPDVVIAGYNVQRFELSPLHLGFSQSRLRHFQFGSKDGLILTINRTEFEGTPEPCLTASEGNKIGKRSFQQFCMLQGLPDNFDLPELNKVAKYRAVGNGVHLAVANEVARAINEVLSSADPVTIHNTRLCACGCGRFVSGKQNTANPTCRKRISRKRDGSITYKYEKVTV